MLFASSLTTEDDDTEGAIDRAAPGARPGDGKRHAG